MKNLTGLKLQEKVDIYINGSPVLKAQHEHELSVEADHEAALIIHYEYTRMDKFVAQIDYNEMKSNRDYDATRAWDEWSAEEARKAN